MISSDPDNDEMNAEFPPIYSDAFRFSKLPLKTVDVCDRRNEDKLAEMIRNYGVLLLAGGHVPTQNRFFARIHLKELIKDFEGIIIGISAGTMNSADVVYAQPELEGEATDPEYQRYLGGLSLTKINVLPHFQAIKSRVLDGLRILEDISLPDSKRRPFYALVDGSFIFVNDGKATLYGEGYLIQNGTVKKICDNEQSILLTEI